MKHPVYINIYISRGKGTIIVREVVGGIVILYYIPHFPYTTPSWGYKVATSGVRRETKSRNGGLG